MYSESIAFIQDTDNDNEAMKKDSIGAAGIAVAMTVSGLLVNPAALAADEPKIIHDAEYYILDSREENGKLIPMIPAKPMFDLMKARHELWMAKHPNTPEARDFPLQGIENARLETQALGPPRMNGKDLPLNPLDVINQVKGWEGLEFDQAE